MGRYKDKRIINGVTNYVMIENDKVVEVLGPIKKASYPEQEKPKIVEEEPKIVEEKSKVGLPLISEDGSYVDQEKQISETNTTTQPEKIPQEQNSASNIHLTPVPIEEIEKIFTKDPIVKIPTGSQSTEVQNESQNTEIKVEPSNIPQVQEIKSEKVPTFEQPPQIPEIKIPKIKINIPQENNAPMQNTSNKIGNSLSTIGTYPNIFINDAYPKSKETEVVGESLQKADEDITSQQPKATSKVRKERKSMAEELEAELLTERKFEEWLKKQKFRENLEKAARYAEETKTQFEEKIPELSNKIEGITGEVKGVEERLGTMDKSVGTLCTGVDCIKEDMKKTQEAQVESERKYREAHDGLEKMVQERFSELGEKVQSLERPTFTCESCGEQVISPLSSYCANCGAPITSWSDEDGQPIRGWVPYWKRIGRSTP